MNNHGLFLQVSHREAPHTISKSYLANPFSDMMEQIPPRCLLYTSDAADEL